MQRHRVLTATTALLLAPVLASGCGEDEDATLTQQEFVDQANEICIQGGTEVHAALGPIFEGNATPEQMEAALTEIIRLSHRQMDDIEALDEPSSLSADVAELLTVARSNTDAAAAQGMGFFENDGDPWEESNELSRALGLNACAGE